MSGKGQDIRKGLPEDHPLNILMEEHVRLLDFAGKLTKVSGAVRRSKGFSSCQRDLELLDHIADHFKESEKHYLREENVLFPFIEKHGVEGPPKQMWSEHQQIRGVKKELFGLLEGPKKDFRAFSAGLAAIAPKLQEMLSSHFFKENNVLFPMALQLVATGEWEDIRAGFDEVGYCCFTPQPRKAPRPAPRRAGTEKCAPIVPETVASGDVPPTPKRVELPTGSFTLEELGAVLDRLPVDITFVDASDEVRFFSNSPDRIFPRTKAILGRKVQNCHPNKSYPAVFRILEDFRNKRRNSAEFWIEMGGRLIHIRYFALRREGQYLGTLEVSQDIAPLKKLKGEKRLLD